MLGNDAVRGGSNALVGRVRRVERHATADIEGNADSRQHVVPQNRVAMPTREFIGDLGKSEERPLGARELPRQPLFEPRRRRQRVVVQVLADKQDTVFVLVETEEPIQQKGGALSRGREAPWRGNSWWSMTPSARCWTER